MLLVGLGVIKPKAGAHIGKLPFHAQECIHMFPGYDSFCRVREYEGICRHCAVTKRRAAVSARRLYWLMRC